MPPSITRAEALARSLQYVLQTEKAMSFDVNTYQSKDGETMHVYALTRGHVSNTEVRWKWGEQIDARRALTDDAIEICILGRWVAVNAPFGKQTGHGVMQIRTSDLPERTDVGFVRHRRLYDALRNAEKTLAYLKEVKQSY